MNETLRLIHNRKSTRNYREEMISAENRERILQAAMRAPTAGNQMLYSIVQISDQRIKEKLAETCDHQPFIARAPLVLLFLADYQRLFDLYTASGAPALAKARGLAWRKPGVGDLFIALCDALIAAHSSVLAAESLGIASCYIGDIIENYEIHRKLFSLPDFVFPITLVCYGYPAGDYHSKQPTPRLDPEYVCFENSYRRFDKEELLKMMKPLEERYFKDKSFTKGAADMGQHLFLKKFSSEFALEMNRSVQAALRCWTTGENSPTPAEHPGGGG
jgi:nitroreductase